MISAQATVQTRPAPRPGQPLPWAALRERAGGGRMQEYLTPTKRTAVSAELGQAARERTAGADPLEAAAEIAAWVSGRVSYVQGATEVQTGAQEAWDMGQGVCQDMAQLTVALLHAAGLPARYVSGYLHPDPKAEPGSTAIGQSHAWVEYWAGAWTPLDPTSGAAVGERHVIVARGRDYADVPPLKGIYHGPAGGDMQVTVEVTRLA